MTECINCKYAYVSDKPKTMVVGNVTINQQGGVNITCQLPRVHGITITDGDIRCDSYEPKE